MNSYRVKYRFYDLMPVVIYLPGKNHFDVMDNARSRMTPYDNVCEIVPERVNKAYMQKKNVQYADDNWKVSDARCQMLRNWN